MNQFIFRGSCTILLMLLVGCTDDLVIQGLQEAPADAAVVAAAKASVQTGVEAQVYGPAGPVGGGVLDPGTWFPPVKGSNAKLVRHHNWVQYNVHTTGLPPGAYTVWFGTYNYPEHCFTPVCTEADIFINPAVEASVFWSDGGIVQSNGVGNFKARVPVGVVPTGEGQIAWPGPGLTNPQGAQIQLWIKYHGPPSNDPMMLYEQTHTLLGGCYENANAVDAGVVFGVPFGIQCFDPQTVVYVP